MHAWRSRAYVAVAAATAPRSNALPLVANTSHHLLATALQTRWLSRAAHAAPTHRTSATAVSSAAAALSGDNKPRNNSNSPHRAASRRIRHHAQSAPAPGAPALKKNAHHSHTQQPPKQHWQRSRLRLANQHVIALVTKRTTPAAFAAACRTLAAKDPVTIVAGTDLSAWNVALQHRLTTGDIDGARALLSLVARAFGAENTNAQLWSDLLFTILRQPSALRDGREVQTLLDALCTTYGAHFVADLLVAVVNGCANLKMFDEATFLTLYHLELRAMDAGVPQLPPRVVGTLVSAMAAKRRDADVCAFTADLFRHAQFDVATFQQQGVLALFASCRRLNDPQVTSHAVTRFFDWFAASAALQKSAPAFQTQHYERAFGAAIQCCVETHAPQLAVRCFDVMVSASPFVVKADENIFVNVLKASSALYDTALFKDVYAAMVDANAARSAGFGSAIRFCTLHRDALFLDNVLTDAFEVEHATRGAWLLDVAQYNDALGCFALSKQVESGKQLFARMAANPFILPDNVTMLQVVENYRDASFAELFDLMELFLEWDVRPNLQVFTSLLATCARRRLVGDALALLDAMRMQHVVPDVKTFTVVAFVLGTHSDVDRIVDLLQTMARDAVATDALFFQYTLNALYGASGIDICFALVRAMRDVDLAIPEGLYSALVDVGTRAGLVERTLHVAYNMECDGFTLSSDRMRALVAQCGSTAELTALLRTFELLHQGFQVAGTPRFEREVYDEVIDVLVRFAKRDAIPRIEELASGAAHL